MLLYFGLVVISLLIGIKVRRLSGICMVNIKDDINLCMQLDA